jgi:hypothetical protein
MSDDFDLKYKRQEAEIIDKKTGKTKFQLCLFYKFCEMQIPENTKVSVILQKNLIHTEKMLNT